MYGWSKAKVSISGISQYIMTKTAKVVIIKSQQKKYNKNLLFRDTEINTKRNSSVG